MTTCVVRRLSTVPCCRPHRLDRSDEATKRVPHVRDDRGDAGGLLVYGPVVNMAPSSCLDGICGAPDNGDPIALYDKLADRWVTSRIAWSRAESRQYIAVSESSDPHGSWYRYAFPLPGRADYTK